MLESTFKIRERTVVIFGPVDSVVQTIATVLQEHGSDIAFLDVNATKSHRFISNLMDMRQVHNSYGRAAAIDYDVRSTKDAKDALSRAAELFGSVDVFIDAKFHQRNFCTENNPSLLLANEAIEFFVGRGKGRNIFLTYEDTVLNYLKEDELIKENKHLHDYIIGKSNSLLGKQITNNILSTSFTDELILKHFPNKNIQEAVLEIKQDWVQAKLVEPVDIAYTVAFLCSPISTAIDAQVVHASYGLNSKIPTC